MKRRLLPALVLGVLSLSATGCPAMMDRAQPYVQVINDTESPVVVSDDSGQTGTVPVGTSRQLITETCLRNRRAETEDGELLAAEDKACEGAKWTIRGPGDATLEP